MSVYPGITPNEVKYILQSTAVNIDAQNPNYIGMLGAGRLMAGEAVKTALSHYYQSLNTTPIEPNDDPVIGVDLDILSDGNNGHGNDEGGFDPSNPGNGNGNNGNGRPNVNGNNGNGNSTNHKSSNIVDGVYDMTGRKVTLEYVPSGMYLVVRNGEVINKVWK